MKTVIKHKSIYFILCFYNQKPQLSSVSKNWKGTICVEMDCLEFQYCEGKAYFEPDTDS